jgi:hypothetical protein
MPSHSCSYFVTVVLLLLYALNQHVLQMAAKSRVYTARICNDRPISALAELELEHRALL